MITPSCEVALSGETGVGAPAVDLIPLVFPAAAPAIEDLQPVPYVREVLNALSLRLILKFGGDLSGEYNVLQTGKCFLGSTAFSSSVTVGLGGQTALKGPAGSDAAVSVGGTGTLRFNLWPNSNPSAGPSSGLPVEVVISDFSFTPLARKSEDHSKHHA